MKLLLPVSLLLLFNQLTAQPALVNSQETSLRNLKFEHISRREGLSHSIVNCVLKDSRGLMWFGTPAGINLYNGYSFRTFKADKSGEGNLNSNTIKTLAEDNNGLLWIGTDFGVMTFDYHSETFTRVPFNDDHALYNVTRIITDHSGTIWVGAWETGLYKYDPVKKLLVAVKSDQALHINDLHEDKEGNIWIAGNIFTMFNPSTGKFANHPFYISGIRGERDMEIKDIVSGKDGTIWLATFRNGLYEYSPSANSFSQHDILPRIASLKTKGVTDYELNSLEKDEWDNLWIGTNQGLYIFDPHLKNYIHYKNEADQLESLNSNEVRSIFYDSSNDLVWLGTLKGGINKCDLLKKEFHHLKFDSENPNASDINNVTAVYEDRGGYLWIGTWAGGLIRYHRASGKYTHIQATGNITDGLPSSNVAAIQEDKYGNIWLTSWRGYVSRIDARLKYASHLQFTNYNRDLHKHLGFEGWDFRHLYKDRNDDLWIVSFDAGVFKVVPTNNTGEPFRFMRYQSGKSTNGLSSDLGWSMFQEKSGIYWIASENGISQLPVGNSRTTKNSIFHASNSLTNNSARLVYEDRDLILWVGTGGGGLNRFDRKTQTFVAYMENSGLPNDMIYGILEDAERNLWISTENGISKFNTITGDFKNYEEGDGLQGNEFNIGAYYKNNDTGEMFFGGTNGITFFFPERIKSNPYKPKVLITDLKLFNRSVPVGKEFNNRVILDHGISETREITLGYQDNVFTFDLVALHFSSPERNTLAYKLEGFNKDWIYVNHTKGSATYTNLNPATYLFKVKAANNDGLWSDEIRTIKVTILSPFWETWWFRTLCIAAISLLVFLLIRLRIVRIKNQKHELEKLVQLRTLEIENQKQEIEFQKNKLAGQTEELTRVNEALTSNQSELEKQNSKIIEQMIKVKGMARQLHDADQRKLQFFTNISHEIRTPLTLIVGPLERVMESGMTGNEKQLSLIHTNVRRLTKLVDQVMDIRKLEAGDVELHPAPGDIISFISKVRDSFSFLAAQKNITFDFNSVLTAAWCWFDSDKLEKIVSNLLSNAFKFTPHGGTIAVRVNLTPGADRVSQFINIEVADSGAGIAESDLDRIFDRFYQAEHQNYQEKGMGIGLSLVRELIRIQQGNIQVQSTPGKGSSFTVSLPFKRSEQFIAAPVGDLSYHDDSEDSHPRKNSFVKSPNASAVVLVVDDNSDIRSFIREVLEEFWEVHEAIDGMDGLEIAKKIIPDVIISDIMMPGMDGLSFCKSVKANATTSHIPVILLTAKAHDDFRIRGLETGADDYIVKPFNTEILKLKISNFLRARQILQDKFSRQLILKPTDISVDSRDEVFIKKAMQVVEVNIADAAFGVDDFCDAMNVTHIHLYRKLHTLAGQSPSEFLKRIRLQRAAQLLSRDGYSVSEVGYQVGFNDPSYFIRCFKKHFGKTPKDFAMAGETV